MSEDNGINKLMEDALTQLEEHKQWLKAQMYEHLHTQPEGEWKLGFRLLISQVDEIKMLMARPESGTVSIVWSYPDDLSAFLRAEATPQHLRATLDGGHVIDMNQPHHVEHGS